MVTVANNMASAMKDQSLADSRKKLKTALQLDQKKLSTRQRRTLMLNNVFPETTEEGMDVDGIEESDWILYGEKYKQKKDAKSEVEDTEIVTRKLKNRKRKRKVKLPKNYDPNVQPDPERWLPKQERAAYKKRQKKNRDRDIGRGTQGSAATNPNVEFTTASPSSPSPMATMPEGPRQLRPKQQPKKKKKPSKF
ncbi:SRP72 RNA-binding domain protein [Teladorsagia circumcincta]|uniref:SRP72 RNA-binding domain protein n=1 Tax=Teladorsagia circumcincta TaxID=45464 RepID=A0A2G9TQV7_TELCI|nr:SRP72 RNA-binding domain protein [Teladorsagia circumcincta]